MMINRLNYEVFLIDYLDGTLNPSLTAELLLFLDQNPDIKDELNGIKDVVLVGEFKIFPDKSNLKKKSFLKDGIDNEFDYLCIASLEGTLTHDEKSALDKIIKDDPKKKDHLQIYPKVIIDSDDTITFSYKNKIKRTSLIPIRYSTLRLSLSIAATITLIVGVYTIGKLMISNNPLDEYSKSSIAESTTPNLKTTMEEVLNKPAFDKPITFIAERNTSESIQISEEEQRVRINIEESIPNFIHRIDLKELSTQENLQQERVVQIATRYISKNQIPIDHLFAQQPSNIRVRDAKEIGVFEVIQYGIQSFGRLMGSDINLNASKDKNGNIENINFESNLVSFSTPLRKNE